MPLHPFGGGRNRFGLSLLLGRERVSDCLSGKSTRGMPGDKFVGEEGIPEPRARCLRDDARV